MSNRREEIDFLLEEEYALECQLDRIRKRIQVLLAETAVSSTVHLRLIQGGKSDTESATIE